jgi:hypothetical protein
MKEYFLVDVSIGGRASETRVGMEICLGLNTYRQTYSYGKHDLKWKSNRNLNLFICFIMP